MASSGNGPRDWSPAGSWAEPPAPPGRTTTMVIEPTRPGRATSTRLLGLFAVLLGLVSCWLPISLPAAETGSRGWVVTTVGISGLSCALAAARARRARGQNAGALAILGGTLGIIGTVLCIWSLVAFYLPATVPPVPLIASMAAGSQTAVSVPVLAPVVVAPAARIVAPIAGADVVAPVDQLYANVRHIAFNLCIGLAGTTQAHEQYGDAFAGVPATLVIQPDGMVSGGSAAYSRLPTDMALEYSATPAGAYSLTVRDVVSGIGVGCDSGSNRVINR